MYACRLSYFFQTYIPSHNVIVCKLSVSDNFLIKFKHMFFTTSSKSIYFYFLSQTLTFCNTYHIYTYKLKFSDAPNSSWSSEVNRHHTQSQFFLPMVTHSWCLYDRLPFSPDHCITIEYCVPFTGADRS